MTLGRSMGLNEIFKTRATLGNFGPSGDARFATLGNKLRSAIPAILKEASGTLATKLASLETPAL